MVCINYSFEEYKRKDCIDWFVKWFMIFLEGDMDVVIFEYWRVYEMGNMMDL